MLPDPAGPRPKKRSPTGVAGVFHSGLWAVFLCYFAGSVFVSLTYEGKQTANADQTRTAGLGGARIGEAGPETVEELSHSGTRLTDDVPGRRYGGKRIS